jgi:hypothetical protein
MLSKHWNVPEERHVILNCEPFQGFEKRSDVVVKANEKPLQALSLYFSADLKPVKGSISSCAH